MSPNEPRAKAASRSSEAPITSSRARPPKTPAGDQAKNLLLVAASPSDPRPAKQVGRPKTPLLDRLGISLADLASWPDQQTPCWLQPATPRTVWLDGKMRTTRRLLLSYILGVDDLHKTWRVASTCPNGKACSNPHHSRITTMNLTDGTAIEPLPASAIEQFMIVDEDDEIIDARDWILSDPEVRKAMSVEELHAACGGVYETEILRQALAKAQA